MTDTHVVVRQQDLAVVCTACGEDLKIQLPVSIDVWLAAAKVFVAQHRDCGTP